MVYPGLESVTFADLSVNVPIIKLSGLTKRYFVPGWRLGWMILFGKNNCFAEIKKGISNCMNVFLMANTVCQYACREILTNYDHISVI